MPDITSKADLLKLMNRTSPFDNWAGNYVQTAPDIDLAGETCTPIGNTTTPFTGSFDGGGFIIRNLSLSGTDYQGLFGNIANPASLHDIKLLNISVVSTGIVVGGLCGRNVQSTVGISNCTVTGTVQAAGNNVGGLIGINNTSTITNCSFTGTVSGVITVGGLCGISVGTIENCYSSGSVTGSGVDIGGLCGKNNSANDTIINCYSTCSVTSTSDIVGGLCGKNVGIISNCYAIGSVKGRYIIGGLCGENLLSGIVTDCYASGHVEATLNESDAFTGGLCGVNYGNITTCYSTGTVKVIVSGNGGLCGASLDILITDCFFLDTAGPDNGLGSPLTDANMRIQGSFTNFDFTDVWRMDTYPALQWEDEGTVHGCFVFSTKGTVETPANVENVCPPGQSVVIKIPEGVTTLHYAGDTVGAKGYLRKVDIK